VAQLDVQAKLAILADAAKYDASCSSSGTAKRDSRGGKGIGSTEGMGICHAYAPDGRCISLLKILLTNSCIFDCAYCINRKSSNVRRARFTADNGAALVPAVLAGLGIALLPDFLIADHVASGALVIVMPDYPMPEAGVYVVRPPGGSAPCKVRVLIDIMVERVGSKACLAPTPPAAAAAA